MESKIAQEELRHAEIFESYTKTALKPNRMKVGFYILLSRIFGFTFSIKIFERDENAAAGSYAASPWRIPELSKIMEEEEHHEDLLIAMLDFKKGFLEMSALSLGVAAISFVVGLVVKQFLGIDLQLSASSFFTTDRGIHEIDRVFPCFFVS